MRDLPTHALLQLQGLLFTTYQGDPASTATCVAYGEDSASIRHVPTACYAYLQLTQTCSFRRGWAVKTAQPQSQEKDYCCLVDSCYPIRLFARPVGGAGDGLAVRLFHFGRAMRFV